MSFREAHVYFLMLLNKMVGWQFSFIWAPEDTQCITQHWREVICCKHSARFDLLQSHPRRLFALGLVLSPPLEGGRRLVVRLPRWFICNTFLGSTKNEILYFVTSFFHISLFDLGVETPFLICFSVQVISRASVSRKYRKNCVELLLKNYS